MGNSHLRHETFNEAGGHEAPYSTGFFRTLGSDELSFPMDPGVTLASLSGSLDHLEEVLEPLIAKTLSQNTEVLETIDKAKLQVLVAYVIQDLVLSTDNYDHLCFELITEADRKNLVYLKARGLDPAKHTITEELVSVYFPLRPTERASLTRSLHRRHESKLTLTRLLQQRTPKHVSSTV